MERVLFKTFQVLDIDKNAIGLRNENNTPYFCTPVGAEIIGDIGVDGIHFCFIPVVDENMVFAVSPIPCGPHHVEPIAYDFIDFMRLILSCGDAAPLEQIAWIGEVDFVNMIQSNAERFMGDQINACQTIQTVFGVEKIIEPYRYVKSIQAHFNYQSIPFPDEYYDLCGL